MDVADAVVGAPAPAAAAVAPVAGGQPTESQGAAPAQSFDAVFQQVVVAQQAADQDASAPTEADPAQEKTESEELAEAVAMAVEGGIAITVSGVMPQTSGNPAGSQAGEAVPVAGAELPGQAGSMPLGAKAPGLATGPALMVELPVAESSGDVPAASQAAGEAGPAAASAGDKRLPAEVVQMQQAGADGGDGSSTQKEAAKQPVQPAKPTQTPDRGATVEADAFRPAVDAKEEVGRMQAAAGGREKVTPQVQAAETVLPEKTRELRAGQPSAAAVSERAELPGTAVGAERAAARPESSPAQPAARAEGGTGPSVDRQAVVDQAVRFARLSLEQGLSRFEMRLEPPGLGKLGVVMDLREGALSITFRVESEAVREALQSSLPQLRDALSGQGVNLGGCDVFSSARGGRQQDGTTFQQMSGGPAGESFGPDAGASAEVQAVRAGRSLVDCWA